MKIFFLSIFLVFFTANGSELTLVENVVIKSSAVSKLKEIPDDLLKSSGNNILPFNLFFNLPEELQEIILDDILMTHPQSLSTLIKVSKKFRDSVHVFIDANDIPLHRKNILRPFLIGFDKEAIYAPSLHKFLLGKNVYKAFVLMKDYQNHPLKINLILKLWGFINPNALKEHHNNLHLRENISNELKYITHYCSYYDRSLKNFFESILENLDDNFYTQLFDKIYHKPKLYSSIYLMYCFLFLSQPDKIIFALSRANDDFLYDFINNQILGKVNSINELEEYINKFCIHHSSCKSIPYLKKIIQLEPNNPTYHFKLACIYKDINRFEESLIYAKKSVELDPLKASHQINLSEIFDKLGQNENAFIHARKAIELDSKNALYQFYLSATYLKLGFLTEALVHAKNAVELDSNNDKYKRYLNHVNHVIEHVRLAYVLKKD